MKKYITFIVCEGGVSEFRSWTDFDLALKEYEEQKRLTEEQYEFSFIKEYTAYGEDEYDETNLLGEAKYERVTEDRKEVIECTVYLYLAD